MALISPGIPIYDYLPSAPVTIVGDLGQSAINAYIEVYKDGVRVPISSSGTTEIGSTGSYAWSTSNLPIIGNVREQYYYRFVSGPYEDDGQFILKVPEELQVMPSVNNSGDFLKQIR